MSSRTSGTENTCNKFISSMMNPLDTVKKMKEKIPGIKSKNVTTPPIQPAPTQGKINAKVAKGANFPRGIILCDLFRKTKDEAGKSSSAETKKPSFFPEAKQKIFNELKDLMQEGIIYESRNDGRLTQTSKTSESFILEICQDFSDYSMPIDKRYSIHISDSGIIVARSGNSRYEFKTVREMLRAILKPDEKALNEASGPKLRNEKIQEIKNSIKTKITQEEYNGNFALTSPDKEGRDQFVCIISDKSGEVKFKLNFIVNDDGKFQVVALGSGIDKDFEIKNAEQLKFDTLQHMLNVYVAALKKWNISD